MKTLSSTESRRAIDSGKVVNADCETPGAVALPDGHPEAERVMISRNRKTGAETMRLGAPWLLAGVFSNAAR